MNVDINIKTDDKTSQVLSWLETIKYNVEEICDKKELEKYKELLGHTSQDIDTL